MDQKSWPAAARAGILLPPVTLFRTSLFPALTLARALGPWPFLLLLGWAALTRLQEPSFFVRQGVPFFWKSQEALSLLLVTSLPLVLRLAGGPESGEAPLRWARAARGPVLGGFLGVTAYGALLLTGQALACVLVCMFSVRSISETLRAALDAWVHGFGPLAISAALAPSLGFLRATPAVLVALWLSVQALILSGFGPSEIWPASFASRPIYGIVPPLLAVLGGLTFSWFHANHRLRP